MDVRELPFDQYQRYRLVSDLLDVLRGDARAGLSVLDVGGRTALLRPFLLRDRVTLVDVETSDEPGLVQGSGAALPFADEAFDAVCAFDTLEHVPPALRDDFVRECHRVAKHWVLIAGPYRAPRVDEAEELLARFLREKLHFRHRYLEEHRSHGLPERKRVEGLLTELGARTTSVGHANVDRWLALMCVAMYMDDDAALRGMARDVHRFYNETLYATDHVPPVYRHVVVAAKDGAHLPRPEDVLGAKAGGAAAQSAAQAARTPAPAIGAALTEFGIELMAFDREREDWRAERAKYRRTIEDLAHDLSEHGRTVAAQSTELGDLRREAAEQKTQLETDLAEHKRVLASSLAHGRALENTTTELLGELDRTRAVKQELERDLGEHKKVLAALSMDVAALREHASVIEADRDAVAQDRESVRGNLEAQIAALNDEGKHLRTERDEHRAHAQEIQAELHGLHQEATRINAELVSAYENLERTQRELEKLRARLSDRWDNLKRALSLRSPRA